MVKKECAQLGLLNPDTPATRILTEDGDDLKPELACRKELFTGSDDRFGQNADATYCDSAEVDESEKTPKKPKGGSRRKAAKGLRTFWIKEEDQR